MNWEQDSPIGVIRHDELLNILQGLQMTGACDQRTLAIVAHQVGVGKWFSKGKPFMVEAPAYLLENPK